MNTDIAQTTSSVTTVAAEPANAAGDDMRSDGTGSNDADSVQSMSNTPPSPQSAQSIAHLMAAANATKKKRERVKLDLNDRVQSILRICRALSAPRVKSGRKKFHPVEREHGIKKGAATLHGKVAVKILKTFDIDDVTEEVVRNAIFAEKNLNKKPGRNAKTLLSEDEKTYAVALVEANLTLSTRKVCQQMQRQFGKRPSRQRVARLLRDKGLQQQRAEARKQMSRAEKNSEREETAEADDEDYKAESDGDDDDDDDSTESSSSSSSSAGDVEEDDEVPVAKKAKKAKAAEKEKIPTQQTIYDIMLNDERGFDHAAFDKRPASRAKRDVTVQTKKTKATETK